MKNLLALNLVPFFSAADSRCDVAFVLTNQGASLPAVAKKTIVARIEMVAALSRRGEPTQPRPYSGPHTRRIIAQRYVQSSTLAADRDRAHSRLWPFSIR